MRYAWLTKDHARRTGRTTMALYHLAERINNSWYSSIRGIFLAHNLVMVNESSRMFYEILKGRGYDSITVHGLPRSVEWVNGYGVLCQVEFKTLDGHVDAGRDRTTIVAPDHELIRQLGLTELKRHGY